MHWIGLECMKYHDMDVDDECNGCIPLSAWAAGCDASLFPYVLLYNKGRPIYYSLVPRPSASRARIAYVTFEPLSDS